MIYFVLIFFFICLDQLSKFLITSNLKHGETIPIIENILHITYVRNDGGAFSLLAGKPLFFIIVNIVVITGILIFIFLRPEENKILLTSLAMIASGGIGNNLIDRVRYGYVIDFIDFRIFPVFNIADILITVGAFVLLIYVGVLDRKK